MAAGRGVPADLREVGVPIESTITEYGSMKINQAFAVTVADAPSPATSLTMYPCRTPAERLAKAIRNVHPASRPTLPRPTPRQWKSGFKASPVRLQNTSSTTAWSAMPRVAVPPSRVIIEGVQSAAFVGTGANSAPRAMNPAIETMLLITGAQVNGPKILRALRASPSIAYRP